MPAAGGCGLVPFDLFAEVVASTALEFLKVNTRLEQLQALQEAYNNLVLAVGALEGTIALANLTQPYTNTSQTTPDNPLCGAPRTIAPNIFVTGYRVQDIDRTLNYTQCSNATLAAFTAAMMSQVNFEDPCANGTRVEVNATCTDGLSTTAYYEAAVYIYSYYPCRCGTACGEQGTSCSHAYVCQLLHPQLLSGGGPY